MKEHDVCLLIKCDPRESDASTKHEIVNVLGIRPDQIEYERIKEGIFRLYSSCAKPKPIDDHVVSILSMVQTNKPLTKDDLPGRIYLDVAVMHDTYTCTLTISGESMNMLVSRFPDINLTVSCYPAG